MEKKDPALNKRHEQILRELLHRPENRTCADCDVHTPRWASTNLGVFVCIRCSGIHRKLGVHISTVRSTTLDTWTPKQIADIQGKGNAWARAFYEACVPSSYMRPNADDDATVERWIRDKYERKLFMRKVDGGCGGEMPSRPRESPSHVYPNAAPPPPPRPQRNQPYPASIRSAYSGSSARSHPLHLPKLASQEASISRLVEMGFDADMAYGALSSCRGNMAAALDMLLAQTRHTLPPRDRFARTGGAATPPPAPMRSVNVAPPTPPTATFRTGSRARSASPSLPTVHHGRAPPPPPPPPSSVAAAAQTSPPAEVDLINFADFAEAPATNRQTAPAPAPDKSAAAAPAAGAAETTATRDNFADFSAFEQSAEAEAADGTPPSAAPARTAQAPPPAPATGTSVASTSAPPAASTNGGGGDLLSAIASLYAAKPRSTAAFSAPTLATPTTNDVAGDQWWRSDEASEGGGGVSSAIRTSAAGSSTTATNASAVTAATAPPQRDAFADLFSPAGSGGSAAGDASNVTSMFATLSHQPKKS